ncbi:UDP-N-acetylmuramate dehydrogenase [Candidatus Omnitrophota bacterium]
MMLGYEYGKLLSQKTSLKIGGPVFCWLEPEDYRDVLEAIGFAESNKKPFAVIGKGSNILAQDRGFDGVAINLGKEFDRIEKEKDGVVRVGAALSIARLVKECSLLDLAGVEFLSGIPGTFGGAIFMNAGVRGLNNRLTQREMKDIILDVDVLDLKDRKRKKLRRVEVPFAYRASGLDGKCILGARIKLEKDKKSAIIDRMNAFKKKREWIDGLGFPSAGSVFKNPDGENPAARLIEDCGLKGTRIGGAEISRMHANFIVNVDQACSNDVVGLIELARGKVKEKFGVELELELRMIS